MTTREQIVAAAREADPFITDDWFDHHKEADFVEIERFYAIAFEAGRRLEREECAQTCEEYQGSAETCAAAIRARGDSK